MVKFGQNFDDGSRNGQNGEQWRLTFFSYETVIILYLSFAELVFAYIQYLKNKPTQVGAFRFLFLCTTNIYNPRDREAW